MASAGTVTAYLDLDASKFRDELDRAGGAMNVFRHVAEKVLEPLGKGLIAAGAGMTAFALYTGHAADKTAELRERLSGAFSGKELDDAVEKVREMSELKLDGFDSGELEEGIKRLGTFSDEVTKDLERVANVSARTGETFGSLKDYFAEFTVNPDAQNSLKEIANITPQKLVKFGAVLDATGEKIDVVGKNGIKAQKALRAVVDAEFSGAFQEMASDSTKLASEFRLLTQDLGVGFAELKEAAATALLPVIQYLRDLDPEVKKNIGIAIGLAGALTAAAGAMITLGVAVTGVVGGALTAVLGPTLGLLAYTVVPALVSALGGVAGIASLVVGGISSIAAVIPGIAGPASVAIRVIGGLTTQLLALQAVSLTGLAKAAAVAFGPFAVAVGAVGALAFGVNKTTEAIESQTRETEKLLRLEEERVVHQREINQYVGKTVAQLKEAGKSAKDLANAYLTLQDRMEQARKSGDQALIDRIQGQIVDLKKAKEELAREEADQRAKDKKAALERSKEFGDSDLDAQIKAAQAAGDTELLKVLKKRKSEADKQRKAELKAELDNIELRLAKEEISVQQSLELRRNALNRYAATEEEKRALAIETARVETQSRKDADRDSDQKAEAARKEKFANRMNEIELLRIAGEISAQEEVDLLKRVLKEYDLTEQEKRNLKKQTAQAEAKIRSESEQADLKQIEDARKDKLADSLADIKKARDAQEISAQEEIDQIQKVLETHKLSADEQRNLELTLSNLRAKLRDKEFKDTQDLAQEKQKAAGLQDRALSRRIGDLQKQTEDTGADNSQKIRDAIEEQLRLQIEAIQLETEKAKAATDSAEVRAAIEKNAQAEIQAAILDTADKEEQAIQRQIDARKRLEKEGQKSSFGEVFDISELGSRLDSERATSSRFGSRTQAVPFSNLQSLATDIDRQREFSLVRPDTANAIRQAAQPVRVEGGVEIKLTVDGDGTIKEATGTSLDGKQTEITKNARGMRARVSVA